MLFCVYLLILWTCGAPLYLPPTGGAVVCLLANMGGIIPNYKQKSRKKVATVAVARGYGGPRRSQSFFINHEGHEEHEGFLEVNKKEGAEIRLRLDADLHRLTQILF